MRIFTFSKTPSLFHSYQVTAGVKDAIVATVFLSNVAINELMTPPLTLKLTFFPPQKKTNQVFFLTCEEKKGDLQ